MRVRVYFGDLPHIVRKFHCMCVASLFWFSLRIVFETVKQSAFHTSSKAHCSESNQDSVSVCGVFTSVCESICDCGWNSTAFSSREFTGKNV